MFCPTCRSEYVEGIRECKDCGAPLVDELPSETDVYNFVEILSTINLADIAVFKSILDGAEIQYYFSDENFNHLYPLVEPARLFVRDDDVERAKALLKDFSDNYPGLAKETKAD